MNNILENIDKIRKIKGYSQEYLAQQIGMKQSGLSLIMSGGRELRYNTLLDIAKALDENVVDIILYPDKCITLPNEGINDDIVLEVKLSRKDIRKALFWSNEEND